ncbi:MAG: protein translocase subunit SecD, partial [Acidimicrobiia bacterium]
ALYFLGGETLADFALALLIGIVVGTYSSVFTAAPVVVALERCGTGGTTERPARITAGNRRAERLEKEQQPQAAPAPVVRARPGATGPRPGSSRKNRGGRRR